MTSKPRVIIVGAGLSGLCLAQALIQRNYQVSVFEKDYSPDVRGQGYRLTIDRIGSQALRSCLPDQQYKFLQATSGITNPIGTFSFLDERGREFHKVKYNLESSKQEGLIEGQIDRQVLRQGLLAGIANHVHFGRTFSKYEERDDRVMAWFENGTKVEADILIGADGINSRVRSQCYPTLAPLYTGSAAIFGRTPMDAVQVPLFAKFLDGGGLTAIGPRGRAIFCTTMRFKAKPFDVAHRLGLPIGDIKSDDYMMWAVVFPHVQPSDPPVPPLNPAAVHAMAVREASTFHADFTRVIEGGPANDVVLVPIRYMREAPIRVGSRITLMGDAIHAMPPFGAHGANTALKDAEILAIALSKSGSSSAVSAIDSYEKDMREYSFKAVRSARGMMRLATADFPFKKPVLATALRVAGMFQK